MTFRFLARRAWTALAVLCTAALGAVAPAQDDPLSALEREIAAGTDDAVLAPLYLRAGDSLLRRSELDRAADAFEHALRLGPGLFPPSELVRLARHLAWAGRLDASITTLQRVLVEQPDNLEARIHLARYLSWSNRLLEAVAEADRVLAVDPSSRAARSVKANASAWRGDAATSLPLYQELLAEEDEFEVRAAYTEALLGAGQMAAAIESRERLRPETDRQRARLARLDERIDRYRRPRGLVGLTRYADNDDNDRREHRAGVGVTMPRGAFGLEIEEVRARDRARTADVLRVQASLSSPITSWLTLRGGVGVASVDDRGRDELLIGRVSADVAYGPFRARTELERDVFDETARILSNRIRFLELDLDASYQLTDRWRLDTKFDYRDFSDDNSGWKLELTPQLALRVRNPGVRIGYRRTQSAFERQSGGGYFDPSHLHADHLVLFATLFGPTLQGDLEFYVGEQVSKRFGPSQRDTVLAGSGRLTVNFARRLTFEAELEGGNFSLTSSGGFSYYQLSANLVAFF